MSPYLYSVFPGRCKVREDRKLSVFCVPSIWNRACCYRYSFNICWMNECQTQLPLSPSAGSVLRLGVQALELVLEPSFLSKLYIALVRVFVEGAGGRLHACSTGEGLNWSSWLEGSLATCKFSLRPLDAAPRDQCKVASQQGIGQIKMVLSFSGILCSW